MDQVIALLGYPQYASQDGRRIAYTWTVLNGEWVYPLCFTAQPQQGQRALELTFDQHNVLEDYQLSKVDGSWQLFSASEASPPVSRDMHPISPAQTRNSFAHPTTNDQPPQHGE